MSRASVVGQANAHPPPHDERVGPRHRGDRDDLFTRHRGGPAGESSARSRHERDQESGHEEWPGRGSGVDPGATSPRAAHPAPENSSPRGGRRRSTSRLEPWPAGLAVAERPIHPRRTSAPIRRRARRSTSQTGHREHPRHSGAGDLRRCQPRHWAACPKTRRNGRERPSEPRRPGRRGSARCRPSRGPAAAGCRGSKRSLRKPRYPRRQALSGGARSKVPGRGPGEPW
jgi:hypothetical protein